MSTKSAKPVKTKEEALFDKVKNAISDIGDTTKNKAEDSKEKAEEKPAIKSAVTKKNSNPGK